MLAVCGPKIGFAINTVNNSLASSLISSRTHYPTAAMPSLHFGYSLMIGLTIMTIPLPAHQRLSTRVRIGPFGMHIPSRHRLICLFLGAAYPSIILAAIVATANHFILDAVAGAIVCSLGWKFNGVLLNLLPLEDYFLWVVRIHKPEPAEMAGDIEQWFGDSDVGCTPTVA